MKYNCDDGNALIEIEADSAREAAQEYVDGGDWGEGAGTVCVDVHVTPLDEDGSEIEDEGEWITVTIEPEEPDCLDGEDHDWQSPLTLLGGLEENPGVWGSDHGGLHITEVCARCGIYRVTDTGATNRSNGQRMTSVTFRDADKESLAWLRIHHDDDGYLPDWLAEYLDCEEETRDAMADRIGDLQVRAQDISHGIWRDIEDTEWRGMSRDEVLGWIEELEQRLSEAEDD